MNDETHPDFLGWIVLTCQPTGAWRDDWDGELHTLRSAADDACNKAAMALGAVNVALAEVRYA